MFGIGPLLKKSFNVKHQVPFIASLPVCFSDTLFLYCSADPLQVYYTNVIAAISRTIYARYGTSSLDSNYRRF